MINVAELVNDPDFAESFTIIRSTGSFQRGGYVTTQTQVPAYGCVQPAESRDVKTLPEGDRITGAMAFHASQPIFETSAEGVPDYGQGGYGQSASRTSDQIVWRNQPYRIVKVYPWQDFGYWKAIGVRTAGA